MKIHRSIKEPLRGTTNYEERWNGPDEGLITCWEVGRSKRLSSPELAEKAKACELPILGWKGGVDKKLKSNEKYGTMKYYAQWLGLRGENLDIETTQDVKAKCSKTGMIVIFTNDPAKYLTPETN